jgi:hypothetical protein
MNLTMLSLIVTPKLLAIPLVIAALANSKASYAAFLAAVTEADAARGFGI